jgi:hypothetical protein
VEAHRVEMLRFPHFLDNRLIDGGKVVSLTPRQPFTPKNFPRIFLKQLLNYPQEVEWTPFQTHNFSENLVALGMELGPLDL